MSPPLNRCTYVVTLLYVNTPLDPQLCGKEEGAFPSDAVGATVAPASPVIYTNPQPQTLSPKLQFLMLHPQTLNPYT